jgi:hypothetical protein
MHLVNILRIFAFSLVLGHSNFNNTYFNGFRGFCTLGARGSSTLVGGIMRDTTFGTQGRGFGDTL